MRKSRAILKVTHETENGERTQSLAVVNPRIGCCRDQELDVMELVEGEKSGFIDS